MGYKGTNFSLNQEETALLADGSFFNRKRHLSARINSFLGELESELFALTMTYRDVIPAEIVDKRGKISRGENYRGLPYLVLDAPAMFEKESVFAYRSLMWWGHPFSYTFLISGRFMDSYLANLFPKLSQLPDETLVCINDTPWEHHFEADNLIPLHEFLAGDNNNLEFFNQRGFFKATLPVALNASDQWKSKGLDFLKNILTLIK